MHKALPTKDRKVRQQCLPECVGMPAVSTLRKLQCFTMFVLLNTSESLHAVAASVAQMMGLLACRISLFRRFGGTCCFHYQGKLFQEEAVRSSETSG
jgi:hypothetical protein